MNYHKNGKHNSFTQTNEATTPKRMSHKKLGPFVRQTFNFDNRGVCL